MLDWNDLKFVLETVRQGGLSGAARVLGVNHATVSRRIFAAEEAVGALLFDRLPTGYVPTEAGLQAAEAAKAMENVGAELSRSIGSKDQKLSGPLSITAPQLLFETVLNPILIDFCAEHPDIELTLLAANEGLNLARREADVAIRISDTPEPSLYGTKVADQRSAIYVSKNYAMELQARPEQALRWLKFIHWHNIPSEIYARWPDIKIAQCFNDMVTVQSAIRAGMGASRMPCFLGDQDPQLTRLGGLLTYAYPAVWVLTHAELRRMKRISVFMAFTARRMRRLRPIFDGSSVE